MSNEPVDITDLRPELSVVTVTKEIVPHQLAAELGTEEVWIDGKRVIANVPLATLEAAVTAHVADQSFGEPPEERQLWALRAKAQAVWNRTDTFSPEQMQRAIAGLVLRATRRRVD
jgi:hypothetical protein